MNDNFLIPLSPLGVIAVHGAQAEKFLQGQMTCDVREVTDQQSRLGAHCDPKGRVQFSFRIFKNQTSYYLQLPRDQITHALTLLKKYAVFFKIELADVSAQWSSFGLSGPDASELLKKTCACIPNNTDEVIATNNNNDLLLIRLPDVSPRYLVIGKSDAVQNLQAQLVTSVTVKEYSHWELLEIQAGIPTITTITQGEFTPHDLNYPLLNGVSFNKGCYTGQEIVARMQFLGKLKQHLQRGYFLTDVIPAPNSKLLINNTSEPREVGRVIATAPMLDQIGFEVLVLLNDQALTQSIHLENSPAILTLLDLPYTHP